MTRGLRISTTKCTASQRANPRRRIRRRRRKHFFPRQYMIVISSFELLTHVWRQIVELKFERETVQKRLDKIQQWQEKQAPPETEVAPLGDTEWLIKFQWRFLWIELSEEAKKFLLNDELKNMQVQNEQKKKQATGSFSSYATCFTIKWKCNLHLMCLCWLDSSDSSFWTRKQPKTKILWR